MSSLTVAAVVDYAPNPHFYLEFLIFLDNSVHTKVVKACKTQANQSKAKISKS
jgi:hypothetical protein